ncbi:MAG: hypothetical protein K6T85_10570 [Gorillibacterium sp.]|nr:hypothetical protein [Gorillibacterium sp.]
MLLAENLNDIVEKFDFTESIITDVKWENDLFDLSLTLDYWWEIDNDPSSSKGYGSKLLKLTFMDCIQVNFNQSRLLIELSKEEIHPPSWFTVVKFGKVTKDHLDNLLNLEIVTLDYNNPWLLVQCRGIRLEKV